MKSSNDAASFENGLSGIASKHGISNWRASEATFRGIGEALGKANLSETQLEVYKSNLAAGDPTMALAMQKGFEETHAR